MKQRSFTVERRSLAGRRYRADPDDAAELQAVVEQLRNVPRESMASIPDMLFFLRRQSGKLDAIAGRLQIAHPEQPTRVAKPTTATQRDLVQVVFGQALRRDQLRVITSRKGRRVQVLERSSRQMELVL